MPITDHYARLPLTSIHVDREARQRRELTTNGLIESIRIHGVLNPIIVERQPNGDGRHKLTAGERRYMACCELDLPDIPVRFADELSAIEEQIFELEENVKRADLNWREVVRAAATIHSLYRTRNPGWTQEKTGEVLGLAKATISGHLKIAALLDIDKQVAAADTIAEALRIIKRKEDRAEAALNDSIAAGESPVYIESEDDEIEITEDDEPSEDGSPAPVIRMPNFKAMALADPSKNILLESFVQWAPRYTGVPFNFIHCDFPYGINVFEGPQIGGEKHNIYEDSKELHFKLLETLLTNLDRIASQSCHIMYWFSMQHYEAIRKMISRLAPELIVCTHPLIWHKTDNAGISPNPRRDPRHIYETALLMSRGDRHNLSVVSDVYGAPTDKFWHVHAKPIPMLKHFFTMIVDGYTTMLDPTCGSANALLAAEDMGAKTILGMDIDDDIVGRARVSLRRQRALKYSGTALEI